MSDDISVVYDRGLIQAQMTYQSAILNYPIPPGGYAVMYADVTVPLTRGVMKHFWAPANGRTPEQLDTELDLYCEQAKEQNRPPILVVALPKSRFREFLRQVGGKANFSQKLVDGLAADSSSGHFHTVLIGRVADDADAASLLLVQTPI